MNARHKCIAALMMLEGGLELPKVSAEIRNEDPKFPLIKMEKMFKAAIYAINDSDVDEENILEHIGFYDAEGNIGSIRLKRKLKNSKNTLRST